ncbi:MAG: TIGR01777 family protein [Flavobacteriales bacterium]|nr:MAG: TIGR01777 family protein [Flavobacteriales bacterium]
MKTKVILAGGTGTMGHILQDHYAARGHEVVVLTRRPAVQQNPGVRMVQWDGRTPGAWAAELEHASVVVNLAGRSVDCRYDQRNKDLILNSRVEATRVLGEVIARCAVPPPLWINLSSATVYRHAEDRPMDEATGELGTDFSPQVVLAWEKEFFKHPRTGVRQVAVRCAMVFSKGGGAFPRFAGLVRVGLGGHHGSGTQYVSWVHEADVAHFFQWLADTPVVDGIINLAAPHPLPERELMKALRHRLKPVVAFNIPEWMLGIGAFFLRTETELVLKSRRVVPARALALGYTFKHEHIHSALGDLLRAQNPMP